MLDDDESGSTSEGKDDNSRNAFPQLKHLPVVTYRYSLSDDKGCTFITDNIKELTGHWPDKFLNDVFWLDNLHPDDKDKVVREIDKSVKNGQGKVKYRFRNISNEYKLILDQFNVLSRLGKPVEIIGNWSDISHIDAHSEAVGKEFMDEMTGVLSRKGMLNQLKFLNSFVFNHAKNVYCHIDIDNFSVINASCGQTGGDELLNRFANLIKSRLNKRDLIARLHSDDFAILMLDCDMEKAQQILDEIQETLDEFRFNWDNSSHVVTASFGVVQIDRQTADIDAVPEQAETACSIAKQRGRSAIHIQNEGDARQETRVGEMRWVEHINRALEEDRFILYCQPIVSLDAQNKDMHFEILVRMKDDDGKLILPGFFLPAAEHYNLSVKLDFWVIQTALTWLDAYSDIMPDNVSWGINLSGQSLANSKLQDFVIDQFDRKKVNHDTVYFEVTETAAIANLDTAIQFINKLKNEGCKFALDDFGSGLSSFAYLKNLPVDYIKIDGIFIKRILENHIDKAMVKSIKLIADALCKQTIAEYVENDETKDLLKSLGVNYAQGYGISKPLPLHDFKQYLSQFG